MKGKQIFGLKEYQGRNPNGYFQDLDGPARKRAYDWLGVFCRRWGRNLPPWRFAILVGQANRLAKNPPTYEWSRWMNATKGGYAVQRKYRHEGRHPTAQASEARLTALKARREAEERQRVGLSSPSRHGFTFSCSHEP